jgi:hypothetical protein
MSKSCEHITEQRIDNKFIGLNANSTRPDVLSFVPLATRMRWRAAIVLDGETVDAGSSRLHLRNALR